jgi:hypothetical protein
MWRPRGHRSRNRIGSRWYAVFGSIHRNAVMATNRCLPALPGVMDSDYDLRQNSDGKWEVFCKRTGAVAVVGGLTLTGFDSITANGIVGLLGKRIIRADGVSEKELSGPENTES